MSSPIKFLILSDTHDAELSFDLECDVLLHCGDMTEDGSTESIRAALDALGKVNAELKLVIAGNHEITLDKDYCSKGGYQEADHINSLALVQSPGSGITFVDEGTHHFTLRSGASFSIYASPYTPKYGESAFQYPSEEDRFNPKNITPKWATNVGTETSIIPEGVDIVMTHGPPQYILDKTNDGRSAGCEHLRRAIARAKPRLHCFGHIHVGYGAQRIEFTQKNSADKSNDGIRHLGAEFVGRNQMKRKGYAAIPPGSYDAFKTRRQTLMINASIMNPQNEPENFPWLVELELGQN